MSISDNPKRKLNLFIDIDFRTIPWTTRNGKGFFQPLRLFSLISLSKVTNLGILHVFKLFKIQKTFLLIYTLGLDTSHSLHPLNR